MVGLGLPMLAQLDSKQRTAKSAGNPLSRLIMVAEPDSDRHRADQ